MINIIQWIIMLIMLSISIKRLFCTKALSTQLKEYQPFLDKHNRALKIPHQRLVSEEQRIITGLLSEGRQWDVITFLMRNRKQQIAWQGTIDTLKQSLLCKEQINVYGALALLAHGQTQVGQKYISGWKKGKEELDADESLLYLYTKLITDKALKGDDGGLIEREYTGPMEEEWQKIRQYIQLKERKGEGWRVGKGKEGGKRSILERQIQCFIKVLGYQRKREVTLNNYRVDFIVKSTTEDKQYILQVNGNHHYTLAGKLLPLQMLRALTLSLYCPVRIIHQSDFNKTVGYRNKLDYLRFLLQQCNDINWQAVGPHNSNWVLDSQYKQFK